MGYKLFLFLIFQYECTFKVVLASRVRRNTLGRQSRIPKYIGHISYLAHGCIILNIVERVKSVKSEWTVRFKEQSTK
jgi:hypothetical protein